MASIEEGSLRTLWKVSLPLMLSYFSTFSMMFVDRLFLSQLSEEAFSAASSSGTLASGLFFTPVAIASMSQIFVSQFNGAQNWSRLGQSTWQMLYFTLISTVYLIPLGYFGSYFLKPLEQSYFSLTLYFSPVLVGVAALQSFYLGQGKMKMITLLAFLSNGINIILDPLLIFGWQEWVPSFGIEGAALATGISEFIKLLLLFFFFLSSKNRIQFHTGYSPFQWSLCKKIIQIGLPSALYESCEILGWAAFFWMMSLISPTHLLVASIIQSIMLLFLFSETALEKGVSTIAGNLIGANRYDQIIPLFKSSLTFIALFSLFLFALLFFAPHLLILWFYTGDDPNLLLLLHHSLLILGTYVILENIRWTLGGILSSAGDTFFLMKSTFLLTFFTLILPLYLFVYLGEKTILHAFAILAFYSLLSSLCNYLRFTKGTWRNLSIIEKRS
ncbi:MAG: MATE family efflux transporter [Simkaniaceae bacterium]|nr:MATE family efflux transporter [Simkaniaceae bacterium]